jgi:hypothetical protein
MEETVDNGATRSFDIFELCVALLLGFAALGAAITGFQAGQWGGKQLDAFAEANALTTKAAKSYSEAVAALNSDFAVVGEAKKLILEGVDADSEAAQQRSYKLASYYLTRQLNLEAYKALKLPDNLYDDGEESEAAAAPTTPATPPATSTSAATTATDGDTADEAAEGEEETEPTDAQPEAATAPAETPATPGEDDVTEDEVEADMAINLPEDDLLAVLQSDLDDDDTYETAVFAEGTKLFEDADKKFAEGRTANDNGDKFDMATVFYTVALAFAGLGLVFKSRMRWNFFFVGVAVFVLTSGYLATLNWA